MFGFRTFSHHNLSVLEKVLSDSFIHNGAEVKNLICNSFFNTCDAYQTQDFEADPDVQKKMCMDCKKERSKFKGWYSNDFLSFDEFISEEDKENCFKKNYCSRYLNLLIKNKEFDKYKEMYNSKIEVPSYIGSKEIHTDNKFTMSPPHDHKHSLGTYSMGTKKHVEEAIGAALAA